MSEESFERLLRWLDADRERAGRRYEEIRYQLIKIFVSRGCLISEELADETINRVARKAHQIADTYEGDPALYFYGTARLIYLEYLRRKPAPQPLAPLAMTEEENRRHECLERCVERLTPKNRELLKAYYKEGGDERTENRKEMAESLGMEMNALWVRMHRIRERLRQCVVECLDREQGKDS